MQSVGAFVVCNKWELFCRMQSVGETLYLEYPFILRCISLFILSVLKLTSIPKCKLHKRRQVSSCLWCNSLISFTDLSSTITEFSTRISSLRLVFNIVPSLVPLLDSVHSNRLSASDSIRQLHRQIPIDQGQACYTLCISRPESYM